MAINLGGAFFDFTLNATNFVSGMAKVGSAVSDFSAKATQGYTKTVKASADFSKASRNLSDQIQRTNTTIEALNKSQHALQVNLANTQRAYKNQEQVVDGLTRST
jgi:phage-related minor tail protein